MGLADQLTLARIAAVPFVVLLYAVDFHGHNYWATALFVVAMTTDWFDGRIARRYGRTSQLGSLLDPVADKILVISVLVVLIDQGVFPGWMVAAIVAREFLVSGLRLAAIERGVVIAARDLGKLKTWSQAVAAAIGGFAAAGAWSDRVAVVGAARRGRADLGVRARLRARGAELLRGARSRVGLQGLPQPGVSPSARVAAGGPGAISRRSAASIACRSSGSGYSGGISTSIRAEP